MNTSLSKVSVIIPCYNYGKYLKECIDSVLAQTYPVECIIIVNDGAPLKDTLDVYSKYSETNIIHIWKKNGGLASARNKGIKHARGEYIMCLDADDKLVPGAIEEHVKLMTDDMTIAQCALMEFGMRHVVMIPNPTSLERVMQSNTIYCNAVFSKRMWQQVGGYDESETIRLGYEDWEFWIRMLEAGCKVNSSDFIALRYRCHDGQMTQATSHPNRQKLYKYIYEKHRELYNIKNLTISGYE